MAYTLLKNQEHVRIQGVLLDMDGVILDSEKVYIRFWIESAQALGFDLTKQTALGMRSLNRVDGQRYLESLFGKSVSYDRIRQERIQRMGAWVQKYGLEPKPGVTELFDFLKEQKLPFALTTSSPVSTVETYLKPLRLYDAFTAICSGHDVPHGKPAPDIYLYGAESLHLPPQALLAIEDSPTGITSCHGAGCLPVIVPDLDSPDAPTLAKCFAKADSLADLVPLIMHINAR